MNLNIKRIRLEQAKQCISVNDIVSKTGLSKATVSRAINRKAKATPKTVGLIAKALSIDVTEIISEEE